jgi:cell division septation protein DedD
MNYEFSLNKTAVLSLILCSVLIGVLLFGAGLVVGSQWISSSAKSADTTARNREPELPREPVLHNTQAPIQKPAQPPIQKLAAPQPPVVTTPPAKTEELPAAAAANGEVKIIQEAAAEATEDNAATDPEYVTVQIGVFLDEKEASRLLKDVERKGYAPSFFSSRDAEARQWYAVRIGAYSDKQQAANAAANFTKQEKIKAIVRPLGSL